MILRFLSIHKSYIIFTSPISNVLLLNSLEQVGIYVKVEIVGQYVSLRILFSIRCRAESKVLKSFSSSVDLNTLFACVSDCVEQGFIVSLYSAYLFYKVVDVLWLWP